MCHTDLQIHIYSYSIPQYLRYGLNLELISMKMVLSSFSCYTGLSDLYSPTYILWLWCEGNVNVRKAQSHCGNCWSESLLQKNLENPCRNLWEPLVYSACSGKVLYEHECTLESVNFLKRSSIQFWVLLCSASIKWFGIVMAHSTKHPWPAINVPNHPYFAVNLWSHGIIMVLLWTLWMFTNISWVYYRLLWVFMIVHNRIRNDIWPYNIFVKSGSL